MNIIIDYLPSLFEGEIKDDLLDFFSSNDKASRYLILSDFAIGDKSIANDVISYTILSYDNENTIKLLSTIKTHMKKDLKKTRSVSSEIIEILRDDSIFHISLLLGRRFYSENDYELSKINIMSSIQSSIDELSRSSREDEIEWVRVLEGFKKKVNRKSLNIKLISDIAIYSLFSGYIMYLLVRYSDVKEIALIPDRDKITTAYDNISYILCQANYHAICVKQNTPTIKVESVYHYYPNIVAAYDEFIRLPDYIAGTLAELDLNSDTVSKEKYVTLLREVISDNSFCKTFKLQFIENQMTLNQIFLTFDNPDSNNQSQTND